MLFIFFQVRLTLLYLQQKNSNVIRITADISADISADITADITADISASSQLSPNSSVLVKPYISSSCMYTSRQKEETPNLLLAQPVIQYAEKAMVYICYLSTRHDQKQDGWGATLTNRHTMAPGVERLEGLQ